MKEYVITELGYFTESEMRKLKSRMDGSTYMNFEVGWSNEAGNCTLIIKTDYFRDVDGLTYEEEKERVFNFFMHMVICL